MPGRVALATAAFERSTATEQLLSGGELTASVLLEGHGADILDWTGSAEIEQLSLHMREYLVGLRRCNVYHGIQGSHRVFVPGQPASQIAVEIYKLGD